MRMEHGFYVLLELNVYMYDFWVLIFPRLMSANGFQIELVK